MYSIKVNFAEGVYYISSNAMTGQALITPFAVFAKRFASEKSAQSYINKSRSLSGAESVEIVPACEPVKGIRFYADFGTKSAKRKGEKALNVIAVFTESRPYYTRQGRDQWEALAGVYDEPNSDTAVTAVSGEYLRDNCKRISLREAASIHPALIHRLGWVE